MTTLPDAVATGRLSWRCNYTVGDEQWRVRQLHRLYQLLLDNRDEFVALVSDSWSLPSEVSQREFAILVRDLHCHISNVDTSQQKRQVKSSQLGDVEILQQPIGVNLIISGPENPFRFLLAPLAASIASGNVTILAATAGHDQRFVSLLSRVWTKYLDRDCNFFVPTFHTSEVVAKEVDLVIIYDSAPDQYGSILVSAKTRFYNTATGSNLALITEGKKVWTRIAQDIVDNSCEKHAFWSERLHAVFVRKEDFAGLQKSLKAAAAERALMTVLDTTSEEHTDFDLALHLQAAKKAMSLLVVQVKSIERAIDAIISSSRPTQQLALLGPEGEKIADFVQNWLTVKVLSVGFIFPLALLEVNETASLSSNAPLLSSTTFARQVVTTKKSPGQIPNMMSQIRDSYKNLIAPLKPEPRGERIGFFTQAEYLAKGVGATLGLLIITGLYYGVQWAWRRR